MPTIRFDRDGNHNPVQLTPAQAEDLSQYIDARRRAENATNEADALKQDIIDLLGRLDAHAIEAHGATVSRHADNDYQYSPAVEALEKALADLRKRERANGSAEKTTRTTIKFTDAPRKRKKNPAGHG